jgi:KDO2-lipid IV(A) lauroyltransferase
VKEKDPAPSPLKKPGLARPRPRSAPAPAASLVKRALRSPVAHRVIAASLGGVLRTARWMGRERASNIASAFARLWGPIVPEHRLAARNLAAAFPEKSPAERKAILAGVWDNLARTTIEYAFLDEIAAAFQPDRVDEGLVTGSGVEHFEWLRASGKPAIIFGAHLANWELTAAIGARLGVKITALYRHQRNSLVAEALEKQRTGFVQKLVVTGRGAAFQIAAAIERGENLGIIVDQRVGGPEVPFFGRPASTNPVVAMLARQFECPVLGSRAIRLPGGRFHVELTAPLELPRDKNGRVDVLAGTAMINGVIEKWVREHPEQWLWLHNRWKLSSPPARA